MFDVVILSDCLIERLWLSKSEAKLILGPIDKITLITKKKVIQETHQAAGVLPYFTTQLLESQVVSKNCYIIGNPNEQLFSLAKYNPFLG